MLSGPRRRPRSVLALACLLALAACGPHAVSTTPRRATNASAAARGDGLLWRVTRGGAVSYLFGTIHVGRTVDEALGSVGTAALSAAETVVVEIDLDAPDTTVALATLVRRRGRLPEGETLEQLLTPPTWRWVADALREQALPADVARLRPWLAVYLVIGRRAATAIDAGEPNGDGARLAQMDRTIVRLARARGQRLVALETAAEQVAALAAMPDATAVAFLEDVARDPAALDRQLRGFVDRTDGRSAVEDVERMLAEYVAASPAMADAMFFARNERWVPRLVPLLAAGDAFVAVGAGHVVGERGLVALLEAHGFEVRPEL